MGFASDGKYVGGFNIFFTLICILSLHTNKYHREKNIFFFFRKDMVSFSRG